MRVRGVRARAPSVNEGFEGVFCWEISQKKPSKPSEKDGEWRSKRAVFSSFRPFCDHAQPPMAMKRFLGLKSTNPILNGLKMRSIEGYRPPQARFPASFDDFMLNLA